MFQQDCIPVGCVPSATVAIWRGGCTWSRGCTCQGVVPGPGGGGGSCRGWRCTWSGECTCQGEGRVGMYLVWRCTGSREWTWSQGVPARGLYLVLGRYPPGGGGVPGLGSVPARGEGRVGVYLVWGVVPGLEGGTWFRGVNLVPGGTCLGGVPGAGVHLVLEGVPAWGRGCTWSWGVPTQVLPPVNRMTDRCKNIAFATSLRTVKILLRVNLHLRLVELLRWWLRFFVFKRNSPQIGPASIFAIPIRTTEKNRKRR